jgi:hypothetical protein
MELLLPGGTVLALLLWLSTGASRGAFATEHPPKIRSLAVERMLAPSPTHAALLTASPAHC